MAKTRTDLLSLAWPGYRSVFISGGGALAIILLVGGFLGMGVLSSPLTWILALGLMVLLGMGLARLAKRFSPGAWALVGLGILASFAILPTSLSVEFPASLPLALPPLLEYMMGYTICLMPAVALVVAALLLYSGLMHYREWRNAVVSGVGQVGRNQARWISAVVLVLSVLLLAVNLYNLYWGLVWDSTYDPLDILWLPLPLFAACFSGLALFVALPGRAKFAGLLYWALIPVLTVAVYASAKSVDYRQLTQDRAAQVSRALDNYYAREGTYPEHLQQLAPWYLLSIPAPVIINGQDWCYDGGADYYRLGYVDREHWSSPNFVGRLYQARRPALAPGPICVREITVLQKRFPDIYR